MTFRAVDPTVVVHRWVIGTGGRPGATGAGGAPAAVNRRTWLSGWEG
ncbi:hypothetical protein ACIBLA_17645 [Streptomyces sp. NPDC050433]